MSTNGNVRVSYGSVALVRPALGTRTGLWIWTAWSDEIAYLSLTGSGTTPAPAVHKGIRINPNGDVWWTTGPNVYQGAIYATCSQIGDQGQILTFVEFP